MKLFVGIFLIFFLTSCSKEHHKYDVADYKVADDLLPVTLLYKGGRDSMLVSKQNKLCNQYQYTFYVVDVNTTNTRYIMKDKTLYQEKDGERTIVDVNKTKYKETSIYSVCQDNQTLIYTQGDISYILLSNKGSWDTNVTITTMATGTFVKATTKTIIKQIQCHIDNQYTKELLGKSRDVIEVECPDMRYSLAEGLGVIKRAVNGFLVFELTGISKDGNQKMPILFKEVNMYTGLPKNTSYEYYDETLPKLPGYEK